MRGRTRSGAASALAALGLAFAALGASGDAAAFGITLPFTVELESGDTADYGTVEVEEVGAGDLAFTITIDTAALGPAARLRDFYFNLAGSFDDDDDWHKGHRRDDDDDWHKGHRRGGDDDWHKGHWRGDDDDWHKGHRRGDDDDWHKRHRHDDDRDDDGGLRISGIRCNGGACDELFELDDEVEARGGDGASFDFGVDFGHGNEMLQIVSFILSAKSDLSLADVLAETSSTDGGIEVLFAARAKGVGDGDESITIGAIPEPATALLLALGLAGLAGVGRRPRG